MAGYRLHNAVPLESTGSPWEWFITGVISFRLRVKTASSIVFAESASLELSQFAALFRRAAIGEVLRQLSEILAIQNARAKSSAFFFKAGRSASGLPSVLTRISRSKTLSGAAKSSLCSS